MALAAVATLAAVACGSQPASGGGGGGDSKPPDGSRIDSRVVVLDTGPRIGPAVRTVLRTEQDRTRFPGWFAGPGAGPGTARNIAGRIEDADLKNHALVAYTSTTGCSKPRSVQLYADGNRLGLRLVDLPKPPPECYAPYSVLAVFEVPRDRMPDKPRFGEDGKAPDPAGPGELVAFTEVDATDAPGAAKSAEVTRSGDLDRWLEGLPRKTAERVRAKLAKRKHSPGEGAERRFAFLLTGCRLTGAELHAETGKLDAVSEGGENVRCVRAEHYVAVFALESALVPEHPLP